MGPEVPLPLPPSFTDVDSYTEALFDFCSTSRFWSLFCGGVHILDFFTRDPDLYGWLFPPEWREWFELHDLEDILDFMLREDLSTLDTNQQWRGQPPPPESLFEYVQSVRDLCLDRTFRPADNHNVPEIPRHVAVGMKVKKAHEVAHFAEYLNSFCDSISAQATDNGRRISHLVDFGSGQNYLGRTLASPLYNKHVIAVEGRKANIEGSRRMDVHAKLAPKVKRTRIVNKKEWTKDYVKVKEEKARLKALRNGSYDIAEEAREDTSMPESADASEGESLSLQSGVNGNHLSLPDSQSRSDDIAEKSSFIDESGKEVSVDTGLVPQEDESRVIRAKLDHTPDKGSVQYVEHRLQDGNLAAVIEDVFDISCDDSQDQYTSTAVTSNGLHNHDSSASTTRPNLLVMSIHSCGNLSHHGLRSLTLNPTVTAVAIVGCCYNLVTERLTPPSYKLPGLRPSSPASTSTSTSTPTPSALPYRPPGDPHGYPMSERLANLPNPIHLNITARMMAVQAPLNWTRADSDSFFTRHYYRALLQKVFLDRGCVDPPPATETDGEYHVSLGGSSAPIVIGSLRKQCYVDFLSYVRGATAKLIRGDDGSPGDDAAKAARVGMFRERMTSLTDEEIEEYDVRERKRKKEVSIVWTLMSFSAQLVEAVMVVDRWLWLKEQEEVAECWVEAAWEYSESPRNLVVVGVKK